MAPRAKSKAKAKPKAKPTKKAPPAKAGPPPLPEDAVEVSGVWGRVKYSESDPFAEVREIFNHYDRNKTGSIEASELARLCDALGMEMDEAELDAGLDAIGADRGGRIGWDQFVGWWRSLGR